MSNSFFDWGASPNRFVRFDTARAEDINAALDGVSTGLDSVETKTNAAIRLPDGETSVALAPSGSRKNKFLTFNGGTGQPEATIDVYDFNDVTDNIAQINTVAVNIDAVVTAAGKLDGVNPSPISITAEADVTFASAPGKFRIGIALDATRDMLLFGGSDGPLHAIVHDSSDNTFGSPVLVRNANVYFNAVLAATDRVLVCSCAPSATALEAVVLSISGKTITVNTAATATLAGTLQPTGSAFVMPSLIAAGSSFVLSYSLATNVGGLRALTITGTAVTIGAETAAPGGHSYAPVIQNVSGSVILCTSCDSGNTTIYFTTYTVTGTSLSVGTQATTSTTSYTNTRFFGKLTSDRFAIGVISSTCYGAIVNVSGTTATVSTVQLSTQTQINAAFAVSGDRVLVLMGSGTFNVLTDNAGTAVAGTAITDPVGGNGGEIVGASIINTTSGNRVSISGNNPVFSVYPSPILSPGIYSSAVYAPYSYGFVKSNSLNNTLFNGTKSVAIYSSYPFVRVAGVSAGELAISKFRMYSATPNLNNALCRISDTVCYVAESITAPVVNIKRMELV